MKVIASYEAIQDTMSQVGILRAMNSKPITEQEAKDWLKIYKRMSLSNMMYVRTPEFEEGEAEGYKEFYEWLSKYNLDEWSSKFLAANFKFEEWESDSLLDKSISGGIEVEYPPSVPDNNWNVIYD